MREGHPDDDSGPSAAPKPTRPNGQVIGGIQGDRLELSKDPPTGSMVLELRPMGAIYQEGKKCVTY